ncbi:MAG TPA: fibronectin type III domain-containing protein [Verrucomicrobiae bacterium]|nr:fibronectin type III domain-containing protein [Verrucomicrobiae bacterium]
MRLGKRMGIWQVYGLWPWLLVLSLPAQSQTFPTAPTNLLANVVSARIDLSWADTSTNEDGFKIERSVDGTNFTQIAQVLSNTTTHRDTTAWYGTTYYYRVRSYNAAGDSGFSNIASGTTVNFCSAQISVVGWGDNEAGEAMPPAGLTGVVAIAAGGHHSLALKSNGTVVGWGTNRFGEATPPAGLTGVVAIAAGEDHSLALKSDGTVIQWGLFMPPLSGIVAIAGGASYSLALRYDGTVVGYGDNGSGKATPPEGLNGVVGIACGLDHSLALRSDGTVVGWGANDYGQTNVPSGLTGVVEIAAGWWYSLALKSDGTVLGWGRNAEGQVTPPPGLSNVVAIAAGDFHSLALKSDGTVVGWGYNGYGQATPPANLTGVRAIAAGGYHSLAVVVTLSPPSGLTATAVSSNQINLTWASSGSPDGFNIERALDIGGSPGEWTQIASVDSNVTEYSDAGLVSDTKFWYRVQAFVNTCGFSPYSNQANATAPSQPGAPSNLTAMASSESRVDLFWTDNSNNEYGFLIERAPDNGGIPDAWALITTASVNAVGYSDNGLTPNAKYWYRVRAYNVGGYSAYSDEASATTLLITAPSGLYAVALSTNTIQLGWSDNSAYEDGYKIERAADTNGAPDVWAQIATVNSNLGSYADAGLLDGTRYWYRVRAYNALGNSDYAGPVSATTSLSAPTNLTAVVVSESQIDLSWAENSVGEDGYTVERSTVFGKGAQFSVIATTAVNVATYSDFGASCGPALYRVRAYKASLVSAYSNVATADTTSVDADLDGIADCWTKQFFGHSTGQAGDNSRATDDADGDGQNNLTEFLAGTDPTDSASAFRIFSITNTTSYVQIRWNIGVGRTCIVQAASSVDNSFSNISQNIVNFGINGEYPSYSERGDVTNAPVRFYRIRLVP